MSNKIEQSTPKEDSLGLYYKFNPIFYFILVSTLNSTDLLLTHADKIGKLGFNSKYNTKKKMNF